MQEEKSNQQVNNQQSNTSNQANVTATQSMEEHLNTFFCQMAPVELVCELANLTGIISKSQSNANQEYKVITQFSTQNGSSNYLHKDWEQIQRRAQYASQRNKHLMAKILNLRAKVGATICLSEEIGKRQTIIEYQLSKKKIFDLKKEIKQKIYKLKTNYQIGHSRIKVKKQSQTGEESKKMVLQRTQLREVLKSIQLITQECEKCRLQLQMIEHLWQR